MHLCRHLAKYRHIVSDPNGRVPKSSTYHNNKFHDVVAIDNDEVLLLMLKEMYSQEGIHCDTCTDAAELYGPPPIQWRSALKPSPVCSTYRSISFLSIQS